jgi:lambda family phage portal protein
MGIFDRFFKKENLKKRQYNGALIDRLRNDFVGSTKSSDSEIRYNIRTLRDRCRELHRNNAYVKRYVNLLKTNIIGSMGIKLQSQAIDQNKTPDFVANAQIERNFTDWSKKGNCTADARSSFLDVQKLVIENLAVDGEVLIQIIPNAKNDFKFAINVIDIDYLDEAKNETLANGNEVRMGIEMDSNRKPVAYHIFNKHPYDYNFSNSLQRETKRIPAENIIHIYIQERPYQTRGVPFLTPIMTQLKQLDAYLEAELVASRVSASKMGFFTSPDGEGYTGDGESVDGHNRLMNIEAGTFEQLPSGVDFKTFDPNHPTQQFETFVKTILRQIASGLNVPYNELANDLENVSYSSLRQSVLEAREYYKFMQKFIAQHLLEPIYLKWLEMAIMSNKINLPMSKFDKFTRVRFVGKGFSWIDPQKEAQANVLLLKAGLISVQDVQQNYGRDTEDLYSQIQAEKNLRDNFEISSAYEPYGEKDNKDLTNREEDQNADN